MRLLTEILSVSTNGDCLRVELQGKASTDAEWRGVQRMELALPLQYAKSLSVGRRVELVVRLKP